MTAKSGKVYEHDGSVCHHVYRDRFGQDTILRTVRVKGMSSGTDPVFLGHGEKTRDYRLSEAGIVSNRR